MNATDIYTQCAQDNPNSAEGLLVCLTASAIQYNEADQKSIMLNNRIVRNATVLFCGALAFFMQAGFAMVCCGAVRKKNLQNTMLKHRADS